MEAAEEALLGLDDMMLGVEDAASLPPLLPLGGARPQRPESAGQQRFRRPESAACVEDENVGPARGRPFSEETL